MPLNIYVRYLKLPNKVEAIVLPNTDNSFDIYINSTICTEKQESALEHELNHIRKNHLYNDDPVIVNELEAG